MPLSRKIKYADKVINTGNPLLINKKNTYKLWTALQQKLEKINEQQ
jgi:hypothetical protein